ncbi:hypothetical protein EH223_14685 [candidate division KSB1 bacterium]|nr:hypothetical protein [candidate division KSB1 bacterium]RQW01562.1 MAG: hypothetical protein EH223_14685 [candidate division KSB1 bacterium]
MKTILILLSFTLTALADVLSFLPPADVEPGWDYAFPPEIYTPDNLFAYINGEAELYKQYDIVEMATASYVRKNNPALTFTLDIFDMGTPLDAFGVYSHYRYPDMTFAEIGEQAVVSDLSVRFWQDQYFVRLVAGAVDTTLTHTIQRVARALSDTLPHTPKPDRLELLPAEHQIANSLNYLKPTYLTLQHVAALEARYQRQDEQCILFVVFCKDERSARKNLAQLADSTGVRAKIFGDKIYSVRDFSSTNIADYFLHQLP